MEARLWESVESANSHERHKKSCVMRQAAAEGGDEPFETHKDITQESIRKDCCM